MVLIGAWEIRSRWADAQNEFVFCDWLINACDVRRIIRRVEVKRIFCFGNRCVHQETAGGKSFTLVSREDMAAMRRRLPQETCSPRAPFQVYDRSRSVDHLQSPLENQAPRSVSTGGLAPRRLCRSVVDTLVDHPLVWETVTPLEPLKVEPDEEPEAGLATRLFRSIFGLDSDKDREISDDFTPQIRIREHSQGCVLLPPLCTEGEIRSSGPTFLDEYKKTLRTLFSVSTGGEVELKEFSTLRESPHPSPSTMSRTVSLRTFERMIAFQEETRTDIIDSVITTVAVTQEAPEESILEKWRTEFNTFLRRVAWSDEDERLVESLRLQPFATGAYLRAMLLGGFVTGVVFHAYNLMHWGDVVAELRANNYTTAETVIWSFVFAQVVLSCAQLSSRINVYTACWQVSRSADSTEAMDRLESVARSDDWLFCRTLGWLIDGIVVIGLILSQCFFVFMPSDTWGNAVRSAILPLCATCLLGFFWRILLVVTYSATVHDPNTVREARKRGLSKYDLARLSSFVYSSPTEVSNDSCPICLAGFDMGETVMCLPCDKRHSFHADCIRQWLERQNSCPLCQRFVS